ncbi:predicted protein [Naegleria gruberi]|uniref:Predicted protein n=1 Tax=Naegleria gruberi TaxID=5762 RepID=D2V923_NAEGR|nr:uncharacterized protein NAEGRDRAFT_47646 [Naegleria gruberi]EFC46902.1 predicted protein [Naegleria gruberi]|eukprot:XP_002679646.1 predicted protein [Naegleria gruberi strain NEG-M]
MSTIKPQQLHSTIQTERHKGEDQGLTGMLLKKILAHFEMKKIENPNGFEEFLRDYIVNMPEDSIKIFFSFKEEAKSEECRRILKEFKEHQQAVEEIMKEEESEEKKKKKQNK